MSEYIEREAALKILTEYDRAHIKLKDKPILGIASIAIEIGAIPAADVVPVVRGKWIETKTGFHCSACKTKAKGTKDGALLSNFCPNCGARMEES
jgi:DNA-directed RNA polymerase subunit RPC12/RpoP